MFRTTAALTTLLLATLLLCGCNADKKRKLLAGFHYTAFRDSIRNSSGRVADDTANIFDSRNFVPGIDSLDTLLRRLDTLWEDELSDLAMADADSLGKQTDKRSLAWNRESVDSFLSGKQLKPQASCREKDCLLFVDVIKSKQLLYLYIEGELVDSFAVSTGMKARETPNFSVRPSGPVFIRYTSKKFPGGNYQGLGNMPYAVFVKGGYAIHGTTQGNLSKLGSKASHGCIRLHPDNAKIFNELVRKIGLENTWVTVSDA